MIVEGLSVRVWQSEKLKAVLVVAVMLAGCGRSGGGVMPAPVMPGVNRSQEPAPSVAAPRTFDSVKWPTHSRTPNEQLADPVNLIVVGSERHVRHVFAVTGWQGADPITAVSSARMVKAALTGGAYPTAPISPLLLYGKPQAIGYQKNAIGVKARDHLRVWRTPLVDGIGRPVWAIGATKDVAIKWGPDDRLPTHQIAPDIDTERELVVNDFVLSGHVAVRYQLQALKAPFHGVNGTDDQYFTDGKVEVLELSRIID